MCDQATYVDDNARVVLGVVKGLEIWPREYMGRALILYNFDLKYLRAMLGYEDATSAMAHYHL